MAKSSPVTLAIDIGGSGLKCMLVAPNKKPLSERIRVETPQPATPAAILKALTQMVKSVGKFDRVSIGFPGVIKHGVTYTAYNLDPAWERFNLQKTLERRWHKPIRVANDAAVQGLAVVRGKGVELVITLGTGLGSSLFTDGHLVPGLELAHHPWHKGKTYEEWLGKQGLKQLGSKRWNKQLQKAIDQLAYLFNFDHLYIGGGNAEKIDFPLPPYTTRISNEEGLLGGAALWHQ